MTSLSSFVDVALIATVLNERKTIDAFLGRLTSQTVVPRELIIVDGGSTDGTQEALRSWTAPPGMRFIVEVIPGANISVGRNAAIELASLEWIAISDAGAFAEHDWLERLSERIQDDVDVVSGFYEPHNGGFFSSTLAATITPLLSEIDPEKFMPSSRSVAIRKSSWAAVGGYPEWLDYCEDLVFDFALREDGARFAFAADAIVSWPGRESLSSFLKQYYRYARGDGKAGLFAGRHIARYAAYTFAAASIGSAIASRSVLPLVPLAAASPLYLGKFYKRVWQRRDKQIEALWASVMLVLPLVISGDVAKMVGYPAGLIWRNIPGSQKEVLEQ